MIARCSPILAYNWEARRFSIKVNETFPVSPPAEERAIWTDRMAVKLRALFRSSLSCTGVLLRFDPSCLIKRQRGRRGGEVLICLREAGGPVKGLFLGGACCWGGAEAPAFLLAMN